MTVGIYKLPYGICIDGVNYAVNTDFRVWIEIGNTICSREIDIFKKLERILVLAYKENLPQNLESAVEGIIEFYRCGEEKSGGAENEIPIVDFSDDAGMIAAGFLHDYKIDLFEENLHWWKFRYLFLALGSENMIMKVMGYRAVNLSDIKDKDQKQFYRKMKKLYKLKDNRSREEMEIDMLSKLGGIFEEVN